MRTLLVSMMFTALLLTNSAKAQTHPLNTLTDEEKQAGWKLLFDGKTTNGWRGYQKQEAPEGWQAVDGVLTRIKGRSGDLITIDEYDNFELTVDWRIAPGGNSGIIYRFDES